MWFEINSKCFVLVEFLSVTIHSLTPTLTKLSVKQKMSFMDPQVGVASVQTKFEFKLIRTGPTF